MERIRALLAEAREGVEDPEKVRMILNRIEEQTEKLDLPVDERGGEVPDGV